MVESVGKKLHQARLQRGLTIDEAAHATKLRPDKIAALEGDDYSRFANNIYAKGFLQIYGRFLKVDVEEFARTLDNANPISISDYQYLTNAPAAKQDNNPIRREERRPPSFAPLFAFIFLIAAGLAGMWLYQNYERIKGESAAKAEPSTPSPAQPTPNPDAAFITEAAPVAVPAPPKAATPAIAAHPIAATPAIVAHPVAATPAIAAHPVAATPAIAAHPIAGATPAAATPAIAAIPRTVAATPAPPIAGATPPPAPLAAANVRPATPAPTPANAPVFKPLEQDFVTSALVPTADNTTRPNGQNEVLVATVKKTWVTVRRDDPKAPPIFEDYVYPNANPLKLKGARFFIEARDPSVVQITKNGLPYAYQPSGVPVQ